MSIRVIIRFLLHRKIKRKPPLFVLMGPSSLRECRLLSNAPATFQRFMKSIYSDMFEDTIEVFIDDFSVVGDSFKRCSSHLSEVFKRCEDFNLVLNWKNVTSW